jgi:hypothetical protein
VLAGPSGCSARPLGATRLPQTLVVSLMRLGPPKHLDDEDQRARGDDRRANILEGALLSSSGRDRLRERSTQRCHSRAR